MATAGVVNFGTGSPSPAASVVKCYCHQCAKNFILVDQNTEPSCPECHSEFVERLEPVCDGTASTGQPARGPETEESDDAATNAGLRHRRAESSHATRRDIPSRFAHFGYPPMPGNHSVVIHHQHPGHFLPFSRLSATGRREHGHPMIAPPMLIQFPFAPPIHGNPGDYAWGPAGLDNIITRLLNQLDDRSPAKKELVDALPVVKYSGDDSTISSDCSVCKDSFTVDEELIQLPCKHMFHKDCIMPWLQMRDTCPTCRFNINSNESFHEQA